MNAVFCSRHLMRKLRSLRKEMDRSYEEEWEQSFDLSFRKYFPSPHELIHEDLRWLGKEIEVDIGQEQSSLKTQGYFITKGRSKDMIWSDEWFARGAFFVFFSENRRLFYVIAKHCSNTRNHPARAQCSRKLSTTPYDELKFTIEKPELENSKWLLAQLLNELLNTNPEAP
ncbi:hypothetical protein ACTXT7_014232 [Hymenolepis weldensis]